MSVLPADCSIAVDWGRLVVDVQRVEEAWAKPVVAACDKGLPKGASWSAIKGGIDAGVGRIGAGECGGLSDRLIGEGTVLGNCV